VEQCNSISKYWLENNPNSLLLLMPPFIPSIKSQRRMSSIASFNRLLNIDLEQSHLTGSTKERKAHRKLNLGGFGHLECHSSRHRVMVILGDQNIPIRYRVRVVAVFVPRSDRCYSNVAADRKDISNSRVDFNRIGHCSGCTQSRKGKIRNHATQGG